MDHQSFYRSQKNSKFLASTASTYRRSVPQLPCLADNDYYLSSAFTHKYFGPLNMKRTIATALLFSTLGGGVVLAQTSTSSSSTMPPAVTTNGTNTTVPPPVAGANSFILAPAQKRMEDQGSTQVSALTKDDKSIWRGHAVNNGKAVNVALDYQGNITAN
jgi:hypothetical protein